MRNAWNVFSFLAVVHLLAQFKTDEENRLATELLERLRTFGLNADVPEGSRDANTIASAE